MGKELKVKEICEAYNVLRNAKTTNLDDADKLKVFRITNELRRYVKEYDEVVEAAQETMKNNIENFEEKQKKVYMFEIVVRQKSYDPSQLPCGIAEYGTLLDEIKGYNRLVDKACKEYYEKVVSLESAALEENIFEKMISTNDWTMEQACQVGNVIL